MRLLVRLLLIWCGFYLLADTPSGWAQVWPNEPNGATRLLDCNFSSTPGACGIRDVYSSSIQATDGTAPISAPGVVKSAIYAGNSSGGMQIGIGFPQTYREMFMGLMWRTNPEFFGRIVHDKMFFLRGPQTNAYFGMRACPGCTSRQLGWGFNAANADNSHTCADSGLWCYPNVGSPAITIGQWTKIEVYLKSSTTMTSRDGIVRWWINGVLAGNYTNVNHAPYGLNDWTWSETWDGYVNPVPSVEWAHFIDHLTIAVPGSGVTPNPDSPVGPPAAPVGLNAQKVTQ